jgi:hypothetical protein
MQLLHEYPNASVVYRVPLRTPTTILASEVGQAFAECHRYTSFETTENLSAAVMLMVHRLKNDGMLPEQVIVMLKVAISAQYHLDSPLTLAYPDDTANGEECRAAYGTVFDSFLDAYYGQR